MIITELSHVPMNVISEIIFRSLFLAKRKIKFYMYFHTIAYSGVCICRLLSNEVPYAEFHCRQKSLIRPFPRVVAD